MEISHRDASIWKYLVEMRLDMERSRRDASIWKYLVDMRLYGKISSRCVYMERSPRDAFLIATISPLRVLP